MQRSSRLKPADIIDYFLDQGDVSMTEAQKLEVAAAFLANDQQPHAFLTQDDVLANAVANELLTGKKQYIQDIIHNMLLDFYRDDVAMLFEQMLEKRKQCEAEEWQEKHPGVNRMEWETGARR